MDKTKIPRRENGNYRLDIAQKNINKGEAVNRYCFIFETNVWLYLCGQWLQRYNHVQKGIR